MADYCRDDLLFEETQFWIAIWEDPTESECHWTSQIIDHDTVNGWRQSAEADPKSFIDIFSKDFMWRAKVLDGEGTVGYGLLCSRGDARSPSSHNIPPISSVQAESDLFLHRFSCNQELKTETIEMIHTFPGPV